MLNSPSRQLVLYLVGLASVIVILFGIRASASIINPILLAVLITITVLPIPGRLARRGVSGRVGLVLTILIVVLLLGLVILTIFLSVTRLSTQLPYYQAEIQARIAEDLPAAVTGSDSTAPPAPTSIQNQPFLQQMLLGIGNMIVQFGIALLIFFFMISAALSMPRADRLGLSPDAPIIQRVSNLTEDVRRYMTILTGINFLVGLGDTILLLIIGVDYAVLWGVLAWFMGYIPSIGFIISLIAPVLLAWAEFGASTALVVLIGFILINGGVQNFIQPKVMGDRLRISPVVVFISLFVWAFLLGGIGAILAVPLTLLVLTIMENFESTRLIAVLFRYTGEADKEKKEQAVSQVRSMWNKARQAIFPSKE